ncbi:protein phosphatase 2C domain-containing protein [Streptomyces sp. NPDC002809]|uniref:protein phosphatase 2C domain-containing protein n=1 Tax=Streptomyces sp. NPDC002809 TaxID=3154433 RepID=UPI0033256223
MSIQLMSEAGAVGGPNEDFVAAEGTTVVVLDGVSTVPGNGSGCHHGTAWFAGELAGRLLEHAQAPEGGLDDALYRALTDVVGSHGDACDLSVPDPPAAALAVVRERRGRMEYLVLCDCTIVADVAGTVRRITDDRLSGLDLPERRAVLEDPTPAAYAALLEAKRRRRNTPGGYWVAAGEPAAAWAAVKGSFPVGDVRRIALMTDGVSCAVDRYRLMDWAGLLDTLEDEPTALVRRIREAEQKASRGTRNSLTKLHDDATAAYWRIA